MDLFVQASAAEKGLFDFVLVYHGALAERYRQAGRFRQAEEAWRTVEAMFQRWRSAEPKSLYSLHFMIPIYLNWALELARRKDASAALALVRKGQQLASEASTPGNTSTAAAGWPARTLDWTAEVHEILGNKAAAESARAQAGEMWRQLAARTDLPPGMLREAKSAAVATASQKTNAR